MAHSVSRCGPTNSGMAQRGNLLQQTSRTGSHSARLRETLPGSTVLVGRDRPRAPSLPTLGGVSCHSVPRRNESGSTRYCPYILQIWQQEVLCQFWRLQTLQHQPLVPNPLHLVRAQNASVQSPKKFEVTMENVIKNYRIEGKGSPFPMAAPGMPPSQVTEHWPASLV